MSHEERTGVRDLTYSGWHRTSSIRRYLAINVAARLTVIDIDWCEACCFCSRPLALIETQRSMDRPKPARITAKLASMAGIPAYSVSYFTVGETAENDISGFRVQMIQPPNEAVVEYTPAMYAGFLASLRHHHQCHSEGQSAA